MLSLDPAVINQSSPIPAERRLWAAVLCQAVCDLRYHRSALQHFTRLWFESDKREPGSFLWVCELLELDASWLRRRLLEMAGKNPRVSMRPVHRPRQVKAVDPIPAEVAPTLLDTYQQAVGEMPEGSGTESARDSGSKTVFVVNHLCPLSRESLENVFGQLLAAIDICSAARLRTPALILLYSAIDIAGWLNSEQRNVQLRFTEWVDKYLLPNGSLKCTARDLYGARCGLVHSYSSDSDLSRSGKVTTLGYAWKPSTALELQELIQDNLDLCALRGSQGDYFIAVQVEDLIECFRRGIQVFLTDLEGDKSKAEAAYAKTAGVLTDLSAEKASNLLQKAQEILNTATANKSVRSLGRNNPCHCGSGRKFKRCCGRK
jgi:hypothetical protein